MIDTLESIRKQKSDFMEYIVIDGKSTDGTTNLLADHPGIIDHWISEEDYSLYEAMNKGFLHAKGKWIWFINSGDCLLENAFETIVNILLEDPIQYHIIYGSMIRKGNHYEYVIGERNLLDKQKEISFNHPATIVRKDLFQRLNGFDLKYRINADYDFFCRAARENVKVLFVDKPLASMRHGGISEMLRYSLLHTKERFLIDLKYQSLGIAIKNMITVKIWGFIKKILRNTAEYLGLSRLISRYFFWKYHR